MTTESSIGKTAINTGGIAEGHCADSEPFARFAASAAFLRTRDYPSLEVEEGVENLTPHDRDGDPPLGHAVAVDGCGESSGEGSRLLSSGRATGSGWSLRWATSSSRSVILYERHSERVFSCDCESRPEN
jgi:hypothetical protein